MTTVVVTNTRYDYEKRQVNVISRGNVRWRNEPQTWAVIADTLIFLAGGMELALGLGWNMNTNIPTTYHFQFCWFIGLIAGAVLAAPLVRYLQKRTFITTSSLLVLVSGIIFVSVPHQYKAIIAARYVNGIGVGLCTQSFIVHGSEIGAPSYRGAVLSVEQFSITFGIAIQVIYASQWSQDIDFPANCLHGIFLIIFAVIAFVSNYKVIESPIFYLRKGDYEAALECLRLLQQPQIVTNSTKVVFEDLKSYVTQEENQSITESFRKTILPLFKVLLYRSLIAFTCSVPLSNAFLLSSYISLGYVYNWAPIVYGVMRLLGAVVATWSLDSLGRKIVPLFSLLCLAGLNIGYGIEFNKDANVFDRHQMSIIVTLMLIAQFLAGLFTPCSTVYLGEAFPLNLKPYMIALCVCVQQVIHIVTINTYVFSMQNAFDYFIAIGCIMLVLCIYFIVAMPETRRTTLREAQNRFRNYLYLKMY